MRWLLVENRGTVGSALLRVVGASTARNSDELIGMFGSGFKYAIALLMRLQIAVKVFVGKNGFEFEIDEQETQDVLGDTVTINEVVMRQISGSKRGRKSMGFDVGFGAVDWHGAWMGIREFISNAADASWTLQDNYEAVRIELVDEPGKWARDGYTRVYIQATEEVKECFNFYKERFLIFTNEFNVNQQFIDKAGREYEPVRIYRKGVMVGQFEHPSLVHYNLNYIEIDEARQIQESTAKYECARAWKSASMTEIEMFLEALRDGKQVWETTQMSKDSLKWWPGDREQIKENWLQAAKNIFSDNLVVCDTEFAAESARRKGYQPLVVESTLAKSLVSLSLPAANDVLDPFEQTGRERIALTPEQTKVAKVVWDVMSQMGVTMGKNIPVLEGFYDVMTSGSNTLGYCDWTRNTVGISKDVLDTGYGFEFIKSLLEEYSHYITRARDNTRDLQDFAFRIAAKLMHDTVEALS